MTATASTRQSTTQNDTATAIARPRCCFAPREKVSRKYLTKQIRSARVCGMKAQRQADSVAAVVAQPMSAHALLRSVSREGLTSGVRSANVAGMNRRAGTQITGGGGIIA